MLHTPPSTTDRDQVIDTMISLTHLSRLDRAIVAGSGCTELYLALRRRGFTRIGLPSRIRIFTPTLSVGFIAVQDGFSTFETALSQVAPSLGSTATIVILIRSIETGFALKIRRRLEQIGFRIEAGVRCHDGLVLSAYRQGYAQMKQAA